jgi:thioredoxin reductase
MSQTPTTSQSSPVDILILGAGPAGLSIATGVARLLHSAIVFSSNTFRNQESQHMHAVPTWDHRDPAEFRAAARRDLLARYGTTSFVDVGIKTIKKSERKDGSSLFEAIDDYGKSWWGRKVALATGIKDVFPNIDGYSECWVKGM